MNGYTVVCPFCWRRVLPEDGLLHLFLAPRLAYHLFDEHPYEAAVLRLHLERPPDVWPTAHTCAGPIASADAITSTDDCPACQAVPA